MDSIGAEEKEFYDEFEGEMGHRFICVKKHEPDELECESEPSFVCSDIKTRTGNILERLIRDPQCRRPPFLGNWPAEPPQSEINLELNLHQYRAAQKQEHLTQMCELCVSSEPHKAKQPAIICTIGPACNNVNTIVELLEAGMNIARISMAHINPYFLSEPFRNVIEASNQFSTLRDFEIPIAIIVDLKGPEIRTGEVNFGRDDISEVVLKPSCYVRLTSDAIFAKRCTEKIIYVDYPYLIDTVTEGMIILISNGDIVLTAESVETVCILCSVVVGGILRSNQKVHIKGLPLMLPPLTEFDKDGIQLAVEYEADAIAVGKTRNPETIREARQVLNSFQENNNILVFAKIANYEGLEQINEILKEADGIIIEETGLCLDLSPEKLIVAQKLITAKCNRLGKPVFRTGQINFSHDHSSVSQKVVMNEIASAIVDGVDGIILVKDTALDTNGPANVAQLSKLIRESEAVTMQLPFFNDLAKLHEPVIEPSQAIALGAVQISHVIQATAILAVTTSGRTAQMLSWYRPRCPVIAITRSSQVSRQLNFWRSIIPLHFSAPLLPDWFQDIKARYQYAIAYGREHNIINSGDLLVLVSGYRKNAGFTNCIRIVYASTEKAVFDDNLSAYYAGSKELMSSEK